MENLRDSESLPLSVSGHALDEEGVGWPWGVATMWLRVHSKGRGLPPSSVPTAGDNVAPLCFGSAVEAFESGTLSFMWSVFAQGLREGKRGHFIFRTEKEAVFTG